ncbi:MAG TPA: metallophosphoesterase [Polyangiaceae bacterium]|nr:metallophosphoesterase [Polyangiaceae bacterium]
MALVFQLSDLHLLASPVEQEAIFDELVATMRELAAGASEPVGLLAITGDVFDSSTVDATMAAHRFKMLHKEMCRSLGGDVPTVIIPGNHDRRRNGLFGPHREELFQTLRVVLGDRAWVHGCSTPFLCELIPSDYHKLPFFVLAYDSTYLPSGMLSAGGALRQEDLLEAAAQMGEENPDRPVMVLIHHHLVPTPITDLGPVPLDEKSGRLLRWGVQKALPALVSNADREELTMTAMGAGTALSTLHTLGRAVLVLHGHKHYATARLLEGITVGQGDVLIASAGSAGLAQLSAHDSRQDTARLWPSFNVINWQDEQISVDMISFAWKEHQSSRYARRPLVRATRAGSQWRIQPVDGMEVDRGPRLLDNRASYTLQASRSSEQRWDLKCERRVIPGADSPVTRYVETVEALDGARCVLDGQPTALELPAQVHLELDAITRYRVEGAVPRTFAVAQRHANEPSPFASVSFMNRYSADVARLELHGLPDAGRKAFASATDLGTGLERPLPLTRLDGDQAAVVEVRDCPARTLLRIYWRLDRGA